MFSMCSELSPRARIPDTRIPQLMQPWVGLLTYFGDGVNFRKSTLTNDHLTAD